MKVRCDSILVRKGREVATGQQVAFSRLAGPFLSAAHGETLRHREGHSIYICFTDYLLIT